MYVPAAGDIIFYDWEDKESGDDTDYSDHVGIIVSVSGNTIKVIEGNKYDKYPGSTPSTPSKPETHPSLTCRSL